MDDRQLLIRRIAKNAIVLALYVALTFASYPVSFTGLQFRVSELLVLLCFFNRDFIFGITLGCFLCNFASGPLFPWDLLIGTGATLLSCLAISFSRRLGIAILFPIAINSFVIGIEYWWLLEQPYWFSVGEIAIGEATIIVIGYVFCLLFMKKEVMLDLIDAKSNRSFKW